MGTLPVSTLKPGMRLAEDVIDRNGRKLMGAGDAISEQSLRVLKIWGITEAHIEGEEGAAGDASDSSEIPGHLYAAAREFTEDRFRFNTLSVPVVHELAGVATRHQALKMVAAQERGEDPMALLQFPDAVMPQTARPAPADVHTLLQDDMKLGSLPSVFHRLVEVVNDSRSSAADVAEVIANDTDLVARLLRMVNSPFYGMPSRIDTISRAVTVIGSNQLVSLAMGVSIISSFKGIRDTFVRMRDFWEHSVACGLAARVLASYHRMPNTERFFVAGILHDIGRLLMFKLLPDHMGHLLYTAHSQGRIVQQCEKEIVGFTHDRLAGLLLKEWKCPVSLEKNVRYHHLPGMSPAGNEAAFLNVADVLANALRFGGSGERLVPVLDVAAWESLKLPVSVLVQTAQHMEFQVGEITRLMDVDE